MTERSTARVKRTDSLKPARKSAAGAPPDTAAAEIARLTQELEAAHRRLAEFEQRHAEVVNRIDWVIDSLHNLNFEK